MENTGNEENIDQNAPADFDPYDPKLMEEILKYN